MRIKKSLYHAALFRRKRFGWVSKSLRGGRWPGRRAGKLNQGADVLQHGLLIFIRERLLPAGHGRAGFPLRDGPKQLLVRLGGSGRGNEIPRARRQKRSLGAIALPGGAMAVHTMFTIQGLAALQAVRWLREQDAGAAGDQQGNEREAVGTCLKKSRSRLDPFAG